MSIVSQNTLTANGYKATLTNKLKFYKGDRLYLSFSITNKIITEMDSNIINDGVLPVSSSNIEARMLIQNREVVGTILEDNNVVFLLEPEYVDVGTNYFQIVIIEHNEDGSKEILHTPPFPIEIAEPIGHYEDNDQARVGFAIVGKSRVADSGTTVYSDLELGYEPWETGDLITADRLNAMEASIFEHTQKLDELLYVAITITSFGISPNTAEIGSTVSTVKLTWSFNKTIESQTLDGVELDDSVRSTTFENLTKDKTYTLSATDGKTTVSRGATISFLNGRYYGSQNDGVYNSEFILSMTKTLSSSRNCTFNTNCGTGQFIFYAIPTRFGTPKFSVGGFEGGFALVDTIDFTNLSGYTEKYNIYRSDNPSLGNITVVVG